MNLLKKYGCMALNTLGYINLYDLFTTIFALKTKAKTFYSIGFSVGGFITFYKIVSEQTEAYVYSPPAAIMILFYATIGDLVFGIWNSVENKPLDAEGNTAKFNSWRIPRTFVRLAAQVFLVAMFFNLSKIFPLFIQSFIVDGLLLVFILTTLWSIIENLHALKFISKEQFNIISSLANIRTIINKLRGKDNNN